MIQLLSHHTATIKLPYPGPSTHAIFCPNLRAQKLKFLVIKSTGPFLQLFVDKKWHELPKASFSIAKQLSEIF